MNKCIWLMSCGLIFALVSAASAADGDGRAVIDKAIKAMGGEERLAKNTAVGWNTKGVYHGIGQAIPFTAEVSVQWPDKQSTVVKDFVTTIINGDKGWVITGGCKTAMDAQQMAYNQSEIYTNWVRTLVPLKDKTFTLTPLDEIKVEDRPVVGVKVSRQGRVDVSLYFDKETGLLVKSRHPTKLPEQGYKDVEQETVYKDYQDVNGVKVAMKVISHRDGKVYLEAEISDFEVVDKFDDAVFMG